MSLEDSVVQPDVRLTVHKMYYMLQGWSINVVIFLISDRLQSLCSLNYTNHYMMRNLKL